MDANTAFETFLALQVDDNDRTQSTTQLSPVTINRLRVAFMAGWNARDAIKDDQ